MKKSRQVTFIECLLIVEKILELEKKSNSIISDLFHSCMFKFPFEFGVLTLSQKLSLTSPSGKTGIMYTRPGVAYFPLNRGLIAFWKHIFYI